MAFAKARTALAQLEEKLRRQLGLAGEIGTTFVPELTPVLIVGDLREAGNAANVGRSFMWHSTAMGAATYQSVRVETDVLITHIFMAGSNAAANNAPVFLTVPGQAPAVAVTTLAGTWCDRKTISGDQVPLTQGPSGALTGTNVNDQNRLLNPYLVAGVSLVIPVNIMLPTGSALNAQTAVSSITWGFAGRIWP